MPLSQPEIHEHAPLDSNSKNNHNLPNGFFVDEATGRRLEELCCAMTDSCGLITAVLQLVALETEDEKRTRLINAALNLSSKAIRSVKMFLGEWSVLKQGSGCEAAEAERIISAWNAFASISLPAVMNALRITGGNKKAASRILRISEHALSRRLEGHEFAALLQEQGAEVAPANLD